MKTTFKEIANTWYNLITIGLSYDYKNSLLCIINHLNRFIGDKDITEIRPYDIDIIIASLANCNPNTNKPMSKKYLKQIIQTANRIFDFADDNDLIIKNPARKKKVPKNAPERIVEAISAELQQLIIEFDDKYKIGVMIMMFCGLRTGELLALEWNDIDFTNRTLVVNKSEVRVGKSKYAVTPNTKNGKSRIVKIPTQVCEWLKKQKEISTSYLVCPNSDDKLQTLNDWKLGWQHYQNRLNYFSYSKKCKENNIDCEGYHSPKKIPRVIETFNPHQLRHTYATLLYMAGVDIKTASELLGHSDVTVTLKIYIDLDKKYKEININKFDEFIKSDLDLSNI